MDSKHKGFKVNLLIHKEEKVKLTTRLLKWVLSSGRFIVIIVELITISAFIYRYKLDADLVDIQDNIKKQIPYLESLKDDEIAIKQTQFQLATIKQGRADNANFAQIITQIAKLTPKNTKLTSITLDRTQNFPKTSLIITGQTPLNLEISAFMQALQKNPAFTDITLTNISFEGQTTFTITGSLTGSGVSS